MSEQGRLNSLQALRAYAAVTVLVGHAAAEVLESHGIATPSKMFALFAGVDVFFVISGFIMYLTSSAAFGRPGAPMDFWIRRIIRIVPLYWLFTTLMVVALMVVGDAVHSTEADVGHIISSYLFFPAERPDGRIAPVLSLGWTLNYEMFFYLLFGLCLFVRRRLGIILLLTALVALAAYGFIAKPTNPAIRFWTNNVILEFAFGVLLGVVYARIPRTDNPLLPALLFGVGLVLLFVLPIDDLPRFIFGGIPAVFIVLAGLVVAPQTDGRIWHWVIRLGNASFALYLCHRFVLRISSMIFDRLDLPVVLELAGYVGLCLLVSCIVAIATYYWIERPVLKWLNGRYRTAKSDRPGRWPAQRINSATSEAQ